MMSLIARIRRRLTGHTEPHDAQAWSDPFGLLRQKWVEVPAGVDRLRTDDLLQLPDAELAAEWEARRSAAVDGEMFSVRGWYYALYRDALRDKRVVDVGSGLGFDAIALASAGAQVICADIVESNLRLIERVARIHGLDGLEFVYLKDLSSYANLPEVDVVWCVGSMIHAPVEIAEKEAEWLLRKLRIGGRWIELGYPRERWLAEGRLSPTRWGDKTDGGAPWVEWYDLDKLLRRLSAGKFEVVLSLNFHGDEFNWFDLLRIG